MGLLDSLNPLSLAKNAAESVVDSVLPDSLKAAGSALADVALDVISGDYADLGKDADKLLHDAEQALAPLASELMPPATTEPDAPPSDASGAGQAKTATAAAHPSTTSGALAAGDPSATAHSSAPAAATATTTAPATPTTMAAATAPAATATTTAGSATATAPSTTSATTDASTPKSSSSSDAKDITKFFAQSDADLMAAVRDGKLPDAVKDDPAAMQRLQLRMNEISEMNQLVSQMLAALHDMNKAVIQNIRA